MPRFKNQSWDFPCDAKGNMSNPDHAILALLMDVRDELQALNRHLLHEAGHAKTLRSIRRKMGEVKK